MVKTQDWDQDNNPQDQYSETENTVSRDFPSLLVTIVVWLTAQHWPQRTAYASFGTCDCEQYLCACGNNKNNNIYIYIYMCVCVCVCVCVCAFLYCRRSWLQMLWVNKMQQICGPPQSYYFFNTLYRNDTVTRNAHCLKDTENCQIQGETHYVTKSKFFKLVDI